MGYSLSSSIVSYYFMKMKSFSGHEKVDGVLPAINDMQKAELKMIFKMLYEKVTN